MIAPRVSVTSRCPLRSLAEFAQHLFAYRRHTVEFGCCRDEFVHTPLLIGGQIGAPVGRH